MNLDGPELLVLQACRDLPKDQYGNVRDVEIAQETGLSLSDVQAGLQILDGEELISAVRKGDNYSAEIKPKGILELSQRHPFRGHAGAEPGTVQSETKETLPGASAILQAATKKVPAVTYALGVSGIAAAIAIIGMLITDWAGAFAALQAATKKVPAVKYALGVSGIAAAIAIIGMLVKDWRVAVFGIIVMLVLMAVLLVFAKLTAVASKDFRVAALTFMWFSLALTSASGSLLFTSVFFDWPIDLRRLITNGGNRSGPEPSRKGELVHQTPSSRIVSLRPFGSGEFGVIVTEFSEGASGIVPADRSVTQLVIEHLIDISKGELIQSDSRGLKLVVSPLGEAIHPINGEETAAAIGRKYRASVVVWGWYTKSQSNALADVHYQVIGSTVASLLGDSRASDFSEVIRRESRRKRLTKLTFDDGQLQSFGLHFQISSELSRLASFTGGLINYLIPDYRTARRYFEQALEAKGFNESPRDLEIVRFFLGNTIYLGAGSSKDKIEALRLFQSTITDQARATVRAEGAVPVNENYICKIHNNIGVILSDLCDGGTEEAEIEFIAAITSNPQFAAPYSNLGAISYFKKDYVKARDYLKKAVSLEPDLAVAHYFLALTFSAFGDVAGSRTEFASAVKVGNRDVGRLIRESTEIDYRIAVDYFQSGQVDEGLRWLASQVNKHRELSILFSGMSPIDWSYHDARSDEAVVALGDLYASKREWHEAIRCWERAIEKGNLTIAISKSIIKSLIIVRDNNRLPYATYQLAVAYYSNVFPDRYSGQRHDPGEGENEKLVQSLLASLEEAKKLNPSKPEVFYKSGMAYYRLGKLADAQGEFRKVLALNVSHHQSLFMLGMIHLRLNQTDEAVTSWRSALKVEPNFSATHFQLGRIYYGRGLWTQAIEEYEAAGKDQAGFGRDDDIDYNKREVSPTLHRELGAAYLKVGMWEKAAEQFEYLFRVSPKASRKLEDSEELLKIYEKLGQKENMEKTLCKIGVSCFENGKFAQARDSFEKWANTDPQNPTPRLCIAVIQQSLGDINEAIDGFRRVIEIAPSNYIARYRLGVALLSLNKRNEAVGELRQAKEVNPRVGLVQYTLGQLYHDEGKVEDAIQEFEGVVKCKYSDFPGFVFDFYVNDIVLGTDYCYMLQDSSYLLGLAYEKKGDLGRAAELYSRTLQGWGGDQHCGESYRQKNIFNKIIYQIRFSKL